MCTLGLTHSVLVPGVQYQFHRQTLPIMKIDRGQIQFREYVSTGTEPQSLFIYDARQFVKRKNTTC